MQKELRRDSYRFTKPLDERQKESALLLKEEEECLPLILEKAPTEKYLPPLDRKKFLLVRSSTLGQLHSTIRYRLQLHQDQSFFLLVDGQHMPNLSSTIEQLYHEFKDEDGFLYLEYASQEVFG
ncbi:microtubule-associated proteins 1A/1B light chain 3C [Hyalella azteca]|uniref:Microtubule-associated proteins 1A/1B light chain 3C n=1 Tax=Hyalella azteca TaxID=294128 RepID=A0A8B7P752_HYAAZ|nr:microtubule-associated proteins 1A/1B light chain 3C [Hyalella azteca]